MKKTILLFIVILLATQGHSQTDERKWTIGFHGGLVQYNGDHGNGLYQTDQAFYAFAGLSVSRYLGKYLDASLSFSRGELGYIDRRFPSTALDPNSFLVRHNTTNLLARLYFTKPSAFIRPYVLAGAGLIWYESIYSLTKEHFIFSLPTVGGGVNLRLGPVISVRLQENFMFTTADHVDGITSGGNGDIELFHSAGLTFNLGKALDTDKDGVSDKKDKCQNTPLGVSVDGSGCPFDKDKDGVADYLDICPNDAGLVTLKGCPDSDMDGITDKSDRCPTTFGPLSMNGCPDSDQDGIADIEDKCPGTIKGYKVDGSGCTLDNDNDGVVNEEDKCPEIAGVLVFKGCPDSDADGIPDNEDRCPLAKGSSINKGCPEIPKIDIQKITVIASKIYFETNKAELKLISHSALDDLADILKRNELVNLTIEGHTDSDSDDSYNMTLSQQRTESVKNYLISKGISDARLTPIGYGESKPIATNKTAAGKAKNRRVELKTNY